MNKNIIIQFVAMFAAFSVILIAGSYNLAFSPDSMSYLEVSKNILMGNGIVDNNGNLVNHWPPLYPILLAFSSFISGLSPFNVGLYLNAFLIYAFVVVFFSILKEVKIDFWLSLFVVILFVFSRPQTVFFTYLSEGLFLVLLLLSYLFFLKWMKTEKTTNLILMGLISGLFFLTRYAGIGFIGAYMVCIFFLSGKTIKLKFKSISCYLFPLIIILLPWFLYTHSFNEPFHKLDLKPQIISWDKFTNLFKVMAYWFLGSKVAIVAFVILMVINFIWLGKSSYRKAISKTSILFFGQRTVFILLFLIFSYILFLLISISFFHSTTPFSHRILSPIFPFILILLGVFIQNYPKSKFIRIPLYSFIGFLFISFVSTAVPIRMNFYENGGGYTKEIWRNSKTIKFISHKNTNKKTYSNGIEILTLHTDLSSELLPFKNKGNQMKRIKNDILKGNAQIVYFKNVDWRNYLISEERLLREFDKMEVIRLKDGFIIRKPNKQK